MILISFDRPIPVSNKDPIITIISKANLKCKMSLHKCINQLLVKNKVSKQMDLKSRVDLVKKKKQCVNQYIFCHKKTKL